MREQLALVQREQAQEANSWAGQLEQRAVFGARPASRGRSPARRPRGPARSRAGAPQRRTQACEQLVHPERLRDVVVGARVERGDLLGLVTDDREHEDRHLAPLAELATNLHAARRREGRGRGSIASGGRMAAAASASSAVAASRPRIRRRGGSSRAHAGSAARRRRRGRAALFTAPCTGSEQHEARALAGRIPPAAASVRLCEAPCDREPEPAARGSAAALLERLEDSLAALLRRARARGRRRGRALDLASCSPSSTGSAGRELQGVVEQVHEHALDLRAVDLDRLEVRPAARPRRAPPRRRALRAPCRPTSRPSTARVRRGRPTLEAREVEEVRDQTIQAPRLGVDRVEQAARSSSLSSRSELSSPSVAARIAVSGERRSWLTARRIAVLTARCAAAFRPRPPVGRPPRARRQLTHDDIGHKARFLRSPQSEVENRGRES